MKSTIKITRNKISSSAGSIEAKFKTLPKKAYTYWRNITPIRSGNARRKTNLVGDTIKAKYPYAQRLDEGWSKQAPRGMFEPTWEYIKKVTKGFMRKK